jgi:serine/threonine-protein phosphatase 6 regulatory ankyrin repeat subunit B
MISEAAAWNQIDLLHIPKDHEPTAKEHELITAAYKGYLEQVKTLVFMDRVDVNAARKYSKGASTALVNASQNGHLGIVKFLIGQGADIDKPVKEGITALMVASQNGHHLVVQFLIEHGAYVNHKSEQRGLTALFLAAERGHLDVLNLLVAADARVNVARKDNGDYAVIAAAKHGNVEILVALLAANAHINVARTDHGATPLMAASMNGHKEAVEVCLSAGSHIDAHSPDGTTALFMAAQNGHLSVVEALIKAKANINRSTNDDLSNPLTQAAWKGHLNVVRALLSAGADINHCMADGSTALVIAAEKGYAGIVAELLCMDDHLVTYALKDAYREQVRKYIAKRDGEVVKKEEFKGRKWGVLKSAVKDKDVDVALLVHDKAEVNLVRKGDGNTALILGAQSGNKKVVKLLIAAGADVNARNKANLTALYYATLLHHKRSSSNNNNNNDNQNNQNNQQQQQQQQQQLGDGAGIARDLIGAGADENILHDYNHSSPRLSSDAIPKTMLKQWRNLRHKLQDDGTQAFKDPIDMSSQWNALKGAIKDHKAWARETMDAQADWTLVRDAVTDPDVDKAQLAHIDAASAWKSMRGNVLVKGQYSKEAALIDKGHQKWQQIRTAAASSAPGERSKLRTPPKNPKVEWGILQKAAHSMHHRKHLEKERLREAQYRYNISKEVEVQSQQERAGNAGVAMDADEIKLPAFMRGLQIQKRIRQEREREAEEKEREDEMKKRREEEEQRRQKVEAERKKKEDEEKEKMEERVFRERESSDEEEEHDEEKEKKATPPPAEEQPASDTESDKGKDKEDEVQNPEEVIPAAAPAPAPAPAAEEMGKSGSGSFFGFGRSLRSSSPTSNGEAGSGGGGITPSAPAAAERKSSSFFGRGLLGAPAPAPAPASGPGLEPAAPVEQPASPNTEKKKKKGWW